MLKEHLKKIHLNLMLISLKHGYWIIDDQVAILERNTCETYNVSHLIMQRYFRQYFIWDLTIATFINNLLDFFLICLFVHHIFLVRELFFGICPTPPPPKKFNGPSLISCIYPIKNFNH